MADLEHKLDELTRSTRESIERVNARLDLLLDLAKHVAILQSEQEHQSTEIARIEQSILGIKEDLLKEVGRVDDTYKEIIETKKEALNRLHGRIDEVAKELRIEVLESNKVHKDLEDKADNVDSKLESKVSFVRGAIFVLGFLLAILQGIGLFIYNGIDRVQQANTEEISRLNSRFHENDRQLDQIVNSINLLKERK